MWQLPGEALECCVASGVEFDADFSDDCIGASGWMCCPARVPGNSQTQFGDRGGDEGCACSEVDEDAGLSGLDGRGVEL